MEMLGFKMKLEKVNIKAQKVITRKMVIVGMDVYFEGKGLILSWNTRNHEQIHFDWTIHRIRATFNIRSSSAVETVLTY